MLELGRKNIGDRHVWLDDNFGEAVHIHIDNFRIDLTNEEFSVLCSDICDTMNELINVPGFDFRRMDPVCLEMEFHDVITGLRKASIERMRLRDMICAAFGWGKIAPLPDTYGVKILKEGRDSEVPGNIYLHVGQSDQERTQSALNSIKENGYPYNGEYIMIYENNRIADGNHRAAALWHILGDKEVPVMRLYFSDDVKLPRTRNENWRQSKIYRIAEKTANFFRYLFTSPRTFTEKLYNNLRNMRNSLRERKHKILREKYELLNRGRNTEIRDIFRNK